MLLLLALLFVAFDAALGIKGGSDAEAVVPSMASVQISEKHVAGGVILSNKWVLSSAKYLEYYDDKTADVTVVVGIVNLYGKGQRLAVEKIIVHDGHYYVNNDVSLIKVKGEIKFSDSVAAAALPQSEPKPATKARAAGFGVNERYGRDLQPQLQILNMTTISLEECNRLVNGLRPYKKEQLCANSTATRGSVCDHDDGGPLYNDKGLLGIVTVTGSCGRDRPSVFTNIVYFVKWIKENMQ